MSDQERGNEFSLMIARLRGGATIAQLEAQMQTIVARLIDRVPARADYMRSAGFSGAATPLRDELVGDARGAMLLLQAGVAIVLLIACANVANLLLVRAAGRVREVAIRSSLGASTWRIGRQLAVEGGVLSALGAGAAWRSRRRARRCSHRRSATRCRWLLRRRSMRRRSASRC